MQSETTDNKRADVLREIGKSYFFSDRASEEDKALGLKLILQAHEKKDPEASFIVARLLLDGVIRLSAGDSVERALAIMCACANRGCIQARAYLNAYCARRYAGRYGSLFAGRRTTEALLDFEGVPIRVNRRGILTPIDAVLTYEGDRHVLTLSTNLLFVNHEELPDAAAFEQAVIRGIMAWQGDYEVFGGQKLRVRIHLTQDMNWYDNLLIMPVTELVGSTLWAVSKTIGTKKRKEQMADLLTNKRSFATLGLTWSSRSRKLICIQSDDGRFEDYDEMAHVAKHEFGHALGLGDLYASTVDSLAGVKTGTYPELDSYAITDRYYNLVMCDHHGPVSNNDVEMVILAFRSNRIQLYQPRKIKDKISTALGRGN